MKASAHTCSFLSKTERKIRAGKLPREKYAEELRKETDATLLVLVKDARRQLEKEMKC